MPGFFVLNSIIHLLDLLKPDCAFMDTKELYNHYKINTNFLTLLFIIAAIPTEWKNMITIEYQSKNQLQQQTDSVIVKLQKLSKHCKWAYNLLLEPYVSEPECKQNQWALELTEKMIVNRVKHPQSSDESQKIPLTYQITRFMLLSND
mgnify:CR=1 FL=1